MGQSNRVVKRPKTGYGPVIMTRATLHLNIYSICCAKVKGVDEDAARSVYEGSQPGADDGRETDDAVDESSS